MAWWDLCNRTFSQYKEHLELFLYLLLPAGFTRPPRGGTAGHLGKSFASCYKFDGTNSESPALPTLSLSFASQLRHYQNFFCQLHQELP